MLSKLQLLKLDSFVDWLLELTFVAGAFYMKTCYFEYFQMNTI